MAKEEHIILLARGVEIWNKWRNDSEIIPDLRQANLSNKKFGKVNFTKANLSEANLNYSDFSDADLSGANLSMVGFKEICRSYDMLLAHLNDSYWWSNQESLYGSWINELEMTQRQELKELEKAKRGGAPLSTTLLETNLRGVNFFGTDLEGALLTGACIENWNINAETNLNNVVCQYIYLKEGQQERRPLVGEFQPCEFATLCQTYRTRNPKTP